MSTALQVTDVAGELPFSIAVDALCRLAAKREVRGECWIYTGAKRPNGYGIISVQSRPRSTHRLVYELVKGPIPVGLQIDHLCRNRACMRPDHLEAVDCRTNLLRGDTLAAKNAAKTHCNWGHEFTAENTYICRDGSRECRACRGRHRGWGKGKK